MQVDEDRIDVDVLRVEEDAVRTEDADDKFAPCRAVPTE